MFVNPLQLLDDIMVLRVENGQDFYVTATGNYARSCFGKHTLNTMHMRPIADICMH